MTETVTYCVHECLTKRRHVSTCEDADCRGCLPRQAEHGRLCWPCHRRLELMLTDAPTVVAWIHVHLPRGTSRPVKNDAEMRRGTKHPPAPIDFEVLDLEDQWRASLSGWVGELCEENHLTGPGDREPDTCARFLLTWLSTVETSEWVDALFEELAWLTTDSHAQAPWRPEMRRVKGVPCPECNQCTLAIFGGESDVSCLECRAIIPENRYGIWVQIAAEEASA